MLSIRQFSLRHVSDICYRHLLPTCYRHVTDMLPTCFRHVSDILHRHLHRHHYRHITATLPPHYRQHSSPKRRYLLKIPPLCLYIIRWEGRGREEKERKREVFYKKIGFCKFLLGLYKRILEKKVYICNIRIRNR